VPPPCYKRGISRREVSVCPSDCPSRSCILSKRTINPSHLTPPGLPPRSWDRTGLIMLLGLFLVRFLPLIFLCLFRVVEQDGYTQYCIVSYEVRHMCMFIRIHQLPAAVKLWPNECSRTGGKTVRPWSWWLWLLQRCLMLSVIFNNHISALEQQQSGVFTINMATYCAFRLRPTQSPTLSGTRNE